MNNQLPKPLMIFIALFQGILLALLFNSAGNSTWPNTSPIWYSALITFAFTFPVLLLLTVTKNNYKASLKYTLPFSLLLSALGAYIGYQSEPAEFINNGQGLFIFGLTIFIACFKGLMYIQQYIEGKTFNYPSLFKLSWQNFIIFAECCLFVLLFWGILHLGAGLFNTLGINIFSNLLAINWFTTPILSLAFGFAVIIFRNITSTADNIANILKMLMKFLLPTLSLISLGFLLTLAFTGLTPLWQTGKGSTLVLALQTLTLFFINAVYQGNHEDTPYNKTLTKIITTSVAVLPIYSVISFYGLYIRIDQYGLTVSRCWGLLTCILLACFSFGYLFAIIKKRSAWLQIANKVNIAMGLVVLACMLLVNSPLLNFQGLTANNQVERLKTGLTSYQDLSYYYFYQNLGRQGYLALQEIKEDIKEKAPEELARFNDMYSQYFSTKAWQQPSISEFKQAIIYWPNSDVIPEEIMRSIYKEKAHDYRSYKKQTYYVIAQDLNEDGKLNFVFIEKVANYFYSYLLIPTENGDWEYRYLSDNHSNLSTTSLKDDLLNNKVNVVKPKWNNLKIGDVVFEVQ